MRSFDGSVLFNYVLPGGLCTSSSFLEPLHCAIEKATKGHEGAQRARCYGFAAIVVRLKRFMANMIPDTINTMAANKDNLTREFNHSR